MITAGCMREVAVPLGIEGPRLLARHPHRRQDIAATVAVPIEETLQVKGHEKQSIFPRRATAFFAENQHVQCRQDVA